MPRTKSHKKIRELHLVKRLLGASYRISVRKYRARGAGWRFRKGQGELLLDAELARAVKNALEKELGRI
jgi:hypothetical protein